MISSKYTMQEIPVKLTVAKVPKDKGNPPMGISTC